MKPVLLVAVTFVLTFLAARWLLDDPLLPKFLRKEKQWLYGTAGPDKRRARKSVEHGNVQFVMWKAGEQGHKEDWWIDFHPYWWPSFVEDKR